MTNQVNQNGTYIIAAAVVFAGLIVAAGIVFSGDGNTTQNQAANTHTMQADQEQNNQNQLDNINPVTAEDHIRGDLDAPVKIVEYSDFECPFCQRFHGTLANISDKYNGGEVSLVMRHFPVPQLHSKAPRAAKASECAASLSDQDGAFWKFADIYFERTPSNNRVNLDQLLPAINQELGVDQATFAECMASSQFEDGIQQDVNNARETGGRGTPWSIVIGPNGEKFPINGAQPQAAVESIIDNALANQ